MIDTFSEIFCSYINFDAVMASFAASVTHYLFSKALNQINLFAFFAQLKNNTKSFLCSTC